MTKFIALLRGINVSGQKRISMASLTKSCEALGLTGVRTYLQSGNVVFCAEQADAREIAALLSAGIAHDFGHHVKVLVLSEKELNLVVDANPLWPRLGGELKLFHGTFISEPVSGERFQELELPAQPGEEAVITGQVVYLYCPHGYGRTKLNNSFFEKKLGVTATTRNWRTILALRDICAEQSGECRSEEGRRLLKKLAGGDRRSIGRSNEVVAEVRRDPSLFEPLFDGLHSDDLLIRMRAADAVEKITVTRPEWLEPHKEELLGPLAVSDQQEVRWHVAQMLPRLTLAPEEQDKAVEILKEYVKDKSSIVKTFAMQALAELAEDDNYLRRDVIDLLKSLMRSGTPAMKSRGRRLLDYLETLDLRRAERLE